MVSYLRDLHSVPFAHKMETKLTNRRAIWQSRQDFCGVGVGNLSSQVCTEFVVGQGLRDFLAAFSHVRYFTQPRVHFLTIPAVIGARRALNECIAQSRLRCRFRPSFSNISFSSHSHSFESADSSPLSSFVLLL